MVSGKRLVFFQGQSVCAELQMLVQQSVHRKEFLMWKNGKVDTFTNSEFDDSTFKLGGKAVWQCSVGSPVKPVFHYHLMFCIAYDHILNPFRAHLGIDDYRFDCIFIYLCRVYNNYTARGKWFPKWPREEQQKGNWEPPGRWFMFYRIMNMLDIVSNKMRKLSN